MPRWKSHERFRGTCITQTFGAACEIMPNICYQPPMRSQGVLRACSRSVVWDRCAARLRPKVLYLALACAAVANQTNPSTAQ